MKQFSAQFYKEFSASFSNFNAYILLAAYYILSVFSALYLGDYFLRNAEIMNSYFALQPSVLLLIIPALTMRSWADEVKSGTIELLLTQPVSYGKLVLAKFSASFVFFIMLLLSSIPLFIISSKMAALDNMQVFSAYCGLFLCGMFFCAVGSLISALNHSNILSYISATFILFFITQLKFTTIEYNSYVIPLTALNFEHNFKAFLSGLISFGNIIYFIFGTGICLWLNIITLQYRSFSTYTEKKHTFYLLGLIFLIYVSGVLGFTFNFDSLYDVTDKKLYTLADENKKFLESLDKRIDVTLYEAKNKRKDKDSNYAVYAEYVERILQIISKHSNGGVRVETVLVEPFSPLERQILQDNVPYEEDKFGNKSYLTANFFDNDGNYYSIPAFPSLRQNLLETDIMRILHLFGQKQKKISVFSSPQFMNDAQGFRSLLETFYDAHIQNMNIDQILNANDAVILINPTELDIQKSLLLEQYVLNGGNLIIFAEPSMLGEKESQQFLQFLRSFGIVPTPQKIVEADESVVGLAELSTSAINKDISTLLLNEAGQVKFYSGENYHIKPLLSLFGQTIGVMSSGIYYSNYLEEAMLNFDILPMSVKPGKVYFFYDSDLLQDYTYIDDDTLNTKFSQIIPKTDNFLFLMRLLDDATSNNIEKQLSYKHFPMHLSSIGTNILKNIKQDSRQKIDELQNILDEYTQKQEQLMYFFQTQGYASVKNIGNMSEISQVIEKTTDELSQINAMILHDYQTVIAILTVVMILIIPAILIIGLAIMLFLVRKRKQNKIRRIIFNEETC